MFQQLVRWYSESDMSMDEAERKLSTRGNHSPSSVTTASHPSFSQQFLSYHTPARIPVSHTLNYVDVPFTRTSTYINIGKCYAIVIVITFKARVFYKISCKLGLYMTQEYVV